MTWVRNLKMKGQTLKSTTFLDSLNTYIYLHKSIYNISLFSLVPAPLPTPKLHPQNWCGDASSSFILSSVKMDCLVAWKLLDMLLSGHNISNTYCHTVPKKRSWQFWKYCHVNLHLVSIILYQFFVNEKNLHDFCTKHLKACIYCLLSANIYWATDSFQLGQYSMSVTYI